MSHPCRTSDPPLPGPAVAEAVGGQADPAPAPALDQEGHLDKGAAPPFPAPRQLMPLSAPAPENEIENLSEKSEPEKSVKSKSKKNAAPKKSGKRIGRKPGSPKVVGSGRTTAFTGLKPREIREYLAANSEAVENLCRMARGKPIRRYGPSGKVFWSEVDFPAQKWAIEKVLERLAPALKSTEITGDSDNPLAFKDAGEPLSMSELARRTVFIFGEAAREADKSRRPPPAPREGATARAAGFASQPAAAPAPTTTEPEEPHRPTPGAFDPTVSGVHSEALGWLEGGPGSGTSEPAEANGAAPESPREPIPGEMATVGGYEIRCKENSRENLPDLFEIFDDHGRQIRYPVNGFERALKKIREIAGDVDMTVKISKPRPPFSQSRADERGARSTWAPEVHGHREHQKRR